MKTLAITLLMLLTLTAHAQRARVAVQNGTIVADNGHLLRGEHLLMRPDNVGRIHNENWYRLLRDQYHLNTIRLLCYREPINISGYTCDPTLQCMPVQDVLPLLDSAVAITGRLGMYAIIDYHPVNGLNTTECANWWGIVAQRYKNQTHVLFEAANEPSLSSYPSFQTSIYNQLRADAPNTHIILWSFAVFQNTLNGENNVNQVENGPALSAYSNASIGFHSYGSVDGTRLAQLRSAGYPVFMTERQWNTASLYQGEIQVWENSGTSWILLSCYPRCTDLTQWQTNCTDMHGNHFAQMAISWPKDPGAVDLNVPPPPTSPPSITTHPSNNTIGVGQAATFSVSATGTAPLAYQWQKNALNIGGATGSSYTTPPSALTDNGSTYRCVATNVYGTATSNEATLTVLQGPVVTTDPVNQTVNAGQMASFSVVATGSAPLSYQWQKNGSNITGATSDAYTTPTTTAADNGAIYRCIVSNAAGTGTSNGATLTVNSPPVVTTHPANQNVSIGQTATFSVVAVGTAPLSYQWQKNQAGIGGATSSSYTTPPTTAGDHGSTYRCVVSNALGSATSSHATLTVMSATPLSILQNPGFETGTAPWLYFTNGAGTFTNDGTGSGSPHAAHVTIIQTGSNNQLYQHDITFEANKRYRLTFRAYSNTGRDFSISIHKHTPPNGSYGLWEHHVNLTQSWQTFEVEFTTSGFSGTVNDGRIRFWFAPYAVAGDHYFIDDVALYRVTETPPPQITVHPLSQTVMEGQLATFTVAASGTEPLTYQWQRNGSNIAGATSDAYSTLPATASDNGAVYRCIVSNTDGAVTSNGATLTVNGPPVVTTHPVNQIASVGQTATFSVVAAGTAPLSYQWQKNGTDIIGAGSSSYTTPPTTTGDGGSTYRCVVSNSAGNTTSNQATLTVLQGPVITTDPVNQTVSLGQTATFSVVAMGIGPLSYQWQKNQADIGGATSSSYTTPPVITADNGSTFRCRVSNSAGTATSNAATLTVSSGPVQTPFSGTPAAIPGTIQAEDFDNGGEGVAYHDADVANHGGQYRSTGVDIETTTDIGGGYNVGWILDGEWLEYTVNVTAAGTYTLDVRVAATTSGGIIRVEFNGVDKTGPMSIPNTGGFQAWQTIRRTGINLGAGEQVMRVLMGCNGCTGWVGNVNSLTIVQTGTTLVPPSITTHPSNQTVSVGATATFTVTATGTEPLAYQWQKNNLDIAGGTNSSYTTPPTTTGDGGSTYRCVVSNTAGTTTSNQATLTVQQAPVITTHPAHQTVSLGQTATFSFVAAGTAPLSYQWQKNVVDIGGATNSSYTTLPSTQADDGSTYRSVVSNSFGSATSNDAVLTVNSLSITNVLSNGGFESGTTPWTFYTNGAGSFTNNAVGPTSPKAALISIATQGTNVQLYQFGFPLEATTQYRLTFSAYSNSGHALSVSMLKHTSPFGSYGLPETVVALGTTWSTFTVDFVASGFVGTVSDARLRFWLAPYDAAGDQYVIDDVRLGQITGASSLAPGSGTDVMAGSSAQLAVPSEFILLGNYPNPFNPMTTIEYGLSDVSTISLVVYDILGRRIRLLVDAERSPGYHKDQWDGTDDHQKKVGSGVYIYRLEVHTPERQPVVVHRTMVLLK